jgi:hypothetical protein
MGGRILTLQTQARELGRLRMGYSENGNGRRPRPVKSETWVVTSHSEGYVRAAAALWGGTPEPWTPQGGAPQWRVITTAREVDAILPPGDPLSQSFELWSGGGCQRRCDGVTEMLADVPCLCAAIENRREAASAGEACKETTRLNVILPDLPDLGVWRVESHGYYAATEFAATVDLVLSGTGGRAAVPIRLRLEPRQSKRVDQPLKRYIVPVVELRSVTAGQILAGVAGEITPPRPAAVTSRDSKPAPAAALPAATSPTRTAGDFAALADGASTVAEVRDCWRQADLAGCLDDELKAYLTARVEDLKDADREATAGDLDALWAACVLAAPDGRSTAELHAEFAGFAGVAVEQASAAQLRRFREHLAGAVAAAS